jgi:hypothetical protein
MIAAMSGGSLVTGEDAEADVGTYSFHGENAL